MVKRVPLLWPKQVLLVEIDLTTFQLQVQHLTAEPPAHPPNSYFEGVPHMLILSCLIHNDYEKLFPCFHWSDSLTWWQLTKLHCYVQSYCWVSCFQGVLHKAIPCSLWSFWCHCSFHFNILNIFHLILFSLHMDNPVKSPCSAILLSLPHCSF